MIISIFENSILTKKRHDNLFSVTEKNKKNVMIINSIVNKGRELIGGGINIKSTVSEINVHFLKSYVYFIPDQKTL